MNKIQTLLLSVLVVFVTGTVHATAPSPAGVGKHVTKPDLDLVLRSLAFPETRFSRDSVQITQPVSAVSKPTRSSFPANWTAVSGATSYRLDVSADSQFRSFVKGYQGLDVGSRTNWTVTGLHPGTTYYYRVQSVGSSGVANNGAITNATTALGGGLIINAVYDATITTSPNAAVIEAAISQAVANEEALFSDPITISILFKYSSLGGGALAQSEYVIFGVSWNTFIAQLTADAKTGNDSTADASLPGSALTTFIDFSGANGRAIGLDTPPYLDGTGAINPAGPYDGIVTLNSDAPFSFTRPVGSGDYDGLSAMEHEIDEIMGLGSFINEGSDLRPQDLFSWSSAGVRNFSSVGSRYFSINGGLTNIVGFNQNASGDFGDWLSGTCPAFTPHVQDAFGCPGQSSDISSISPEGINLDVIGYDLVGAISPNPYGEIVSPVNGSTLPSSTVTFSWSAGSAKAYWLLIGDARVTEPGGSNLYTTGQTGAHFAVVRNLPTDGRTIYARLYSLVNNTWYNPPRDYVYTAQVLNVQSPVIAPAGGTYHKKVTVSMATGTPGATIHYTTNGTNPTSASTAYTGAFPLTASKTVKAVATKTGVPNSPIVTVVYTVLPR